MLDSQLVSSVANHIEARRLQLVLDVRDLAVARAVNRRTDADAGRIGVVQVEPQGRHVIAREVEVARVRNVRGAARHVLAVGFELLFVALGLRVAQVGDEGPVPGEELVVPAGGEDLVFGLEQEVTRQRHAIQQIAAHDGVVGDLGIRKAWTGDGIVAQVHFQAARVVGLLALGVVQIEHRLVGIARAPLNRSHRTVAAVLTHVGADLHAIRDKQTVRHLGVIVEFVHGRIVRMPRLVRTGAFNRQRRLQMREAECDTEGVVEKLIDVGEAGAISLIVGIGAHVVLRIHLAAHVHHDRAIVHIERPRSPQVDRAREALTDQLCIGRLVDQHRAQQLRRILIELDAAVVTGAHLLTTVQQRAREAWVRTAQADCGSATFGALRREARQA